jgi:lysophospholipase L1-like esterase
MNVSFNDKITTIVNTYSAYNKSRVMFTNTFFKAFHYSFSILLAFSIVLSSWNLYGQQNSDSTKKWVGTWSTAEQLVEPGNMPPSPGLTNNSLRQVVRVSIGGDSLRVKFSNEFSTSPVTLKSVQIAVSTGGSAIEVSTNKELTFKSNTEVTMNPGAAVTSDPISFHMEPRMDVAISIYFGQTSARVTGHPGSRTTSFLLAGNSTSTIDFSNSVKTDHWYIINGIDVQAPSTAAAVAIIGNSITDGRGSTTNMQNRWPDILSERLLQNPGTQHVGVLNLGIGGNCVLKDCLGPSAISRFERDILNQQGVRWAIIFEGVNDIGGVNSAAAATSVTNNLIAAYTQMINSAHAKSISVYGATIMPFKGNSYYNTYSEVCRNNVNDWIRNSGHFEAVIDFDKVMRNTQDTLRLTASFQNDGLHPDTAGHKTMGNAIDLKLFEDTTSHTGVLNVMETIDGYALEPNYPNPINPSTTLASTLSEKLSVMLKVNETLGRGVSRHFSEEMLPGTYSWQWNVDGVPSSAYFYRLSAAPSTRRELIPANDGDGQAGLYVKRKSL